MSELIVVENGVCWSFEGEGGGGAKNKFGGQLPRSPRSPLDSHDVLEFVLLLG